MLKNEFHLLACLPRRIRGHVARATRRLRIKQPPADAARHRLYRSWSHGHGDGRKSRRRRTAGDRICPSPGPDGQAHSARAQSHNGYHQPVRLRDRHQHAAGRRRCPRRRVWTCGPRYRRPGLGTNARRNSSFDEHDQHGDCFSAGERACQSRARLRRCAGVRKSGCRQGASALRRRRGQRRRCRALPAGPRQSRAADIRRRDRSRTGKPHQAARQYDDRHRAGDAGRSRCCGCSSAGSIPSPSSTS